MVPVTKISLSRAIIETEVMNETIATFSQLNIPKTGLHTLQFVQFYPPLEERLSEMVLDELVSHCTDLRVLSIGNM